jgi:hypothetical protein
VFTLGELLEQQYRCLGTSLSVYTYLSTVTLRDILHLLYETAYQYPDMVGAVSLITAFYIGLKYFLVKTIIICIAGLSLYIYVKIREGSIQEKKDL